jgi:membrane-bound serine protease (ClpP class)
MKQFIFLFLFLLSSLFSNNSSITHLHIKGAIGPASSSYLKKGFVYAHEHNSSALLIALDTPGGLSTSMREMIQEVLNAPIPVIIYVSPKGARAASAGTYLLYASHLAAMAPGTNLGAATPVSMMQTPKTKDLNLSESAMTKKVVNDSVAYITSLAQLRDRNVSWAVQAVREGKSLSAQDALKYGVIDMIAEDEDELYTKIEGFKVKIADRTVSLSVKSLRHLYYEPDWKDRFLAIITNPSIAYILLMLGIYGIFFELMNPGSIYPGLIGLISGIISLYALNLLPFSYAGLLLIILGIALMIAELFVSGFGLLGIAGTISFVLGSLLLFDAKTLGEDISMPLIIAFSLSSLAFFLLLIRFVLSSHSSRIVSGKEEMIGMEAEVIERQGEAYRVHCHGEIWTAHSDKELQPGERVYVDSISGLTLNLRSEK